MRVMVRINMDAIKRHMSEAEEAFLAGEVEQGDHLATIHSDLGELIKEHERFTSNYREALEFIDSFAMSHKNVLPRRTAERLTDLQARLRGLL